MQDAAAGVGEAGNAAQEQTVSSSEIQGEPAEQESSGGENSEEKIDGREQSDTADGQEENRNMVREEEEFQATLEDRKIRHNSIERPVCGILTDRAITISSFLSCLP